MKRDLLPVAVLMVIVAIVCAFMWMSETRARASLPAGSPLAGVVTCGTTATCVPAAVLGGTVVMGSVALTSGTPSTATVTGISPAFTGTTSYVCVGTDATDATKNLIKIVNVSATSFTITGPATVTDTVNYVCVGS